MPKRRTRRRSANFPTRTSLKRLLARWTTATAAMAVSRGRKTAKGGRRIEPSPKPEKSVRSAAMNAVMQIVRNAIRRLEAGGRRPVLSAGGRDQRRGSPPPAGGWFLQLPSAKLVGDSSLDSAL